MNGTGNACGSEDLGGYVLVRVSGEVDLSWSQQVRDAILAALGRGDVGVELSQVGYIDSSGIAALVEGFQRARSTNKRFGLINHVRQGRQESLQSNPLISQRLLVHDEAFGRKLSG